MRIALVGSSRIAARTFPAWSSVPGVSVVGYFSRAKSLRDSLGDFLGVPDGCTETIASRFDCVYVTSLSARHFEDARTFLNLGKHVLVEKPMTLSGDEARELRLLASSRGLILQEGMMHRFHPELIEFRNALIAMEHDGTLRELDLGFHFCLETQGTDRRTRKGGGGALSDLGCYLIDFLTWTFGRFTVSDLDVRSRMQVDSLGDEIDVGSRVMFTLNERVAVQLSCAIDVPSINLWEARGTRGAVHVKRFDPQSWREFSLGGVNDDSEVSLEPVDGVRHPGASQNPSLFLFEKEFRSFVGAVRGECAPVITPEESEQNAILLERFRGFSSG